MKKNVILSVLFSLILYSCSNIINNNSTQGSLSIVIPGSNGRYIEEDQTELPTTYNLKLTRNNDSPREMTVSGGSTIKINNLMSGEYEIIISGSTDYYYFEGKTNAIVYLNRDTSVSINLTKFRKPLYLKSDSGSDFPAGTIQNPFNNIEAALQFTADSQNVALQLDGTFSALTIPREAAGLKHLYLLKAPDASEAILNNTLLTIQDFSLELLDINCQSNSFEVVSGPGDLIIGGNVDLSTTTISLDNGKSLYISKPLPSNFTATLELKGNLSDGRQVLKTDNPDVKLDAEYGKFFLQPNSDNRFKLNEAGALAENKTIYLTLNSQKPGTTYKVKEKGASFYLIDETPYNAPGPIKTSNTIAPAPEPYYFNVGKTYTIEIYESGSPTPVRTEDITISENDSLNKIELDMNVFYVSTTGSDSNDGSSKESSFQTLDKAVEAAGEGALIKVYGAVNIQSPITVGKSLTLKGFENASLNSNIDRAMLVNKDITLTLENITVNGNVTLGDDGSYGNMIMKNGATFSSINTISVKTGQLQMEGSAKAGKIDIQCQNGINITGPLAANTAGTIYINSANLNGLAGQEIVTSSDPSLLSSNYSKFNLDSSLADKNQYMITSNGNFIKNQTVELTVNNRKQDAAYTYKVKEKGTNKYLNGNGNTLGADGLLTDYYFIDGTSYTIDIFEGSKIVGSADIRVSTGSNPANTELYKYYVKSNGSDTANGFSEANAFRTINKAVTAIGSTSDKYTINILDSMTDSTAVVLDSNGPTDLTIKGITADTKNSPILLTGNNFTLHNNNQLTLEDIKCTGTTTLNDKTVLNLNGKYIKAGNVILNGDSSYVKTLSKIFPSSTPSKYIATITIEETELKDGRPVIEYFNNDNDTTYNYINNTFNKDNIIKFDIGNDGRLAPVQIGHIQHILTEIDYKSFQELNMRIYFYNKDCFSHINPNKATNVPSDTPPLNITVVPDPNTPNNITIVDIEACKGFTNLKSIKLPESVKTISASAFRDCTSLETINIPASVTTIESGAFRGCTALKSVTFDDSTSSWELKGSSSTVTTVKVPTENATNLNDKYVSYTWNKIQ